MRYRLEHCIPMDRMVEGAAYVGVGRNFDVGIWTGTGFVGLRHKFNRKFPDIEKHWDDTEARNGTFQPLAQLHTPVWVEAYLKNVREGGA